MVVCKGQQLAQPRSWAAPAESREPGGLGWRAPAGVCAELRWERGTKRFGIKMLCKQKEGPSIKQTNLVLNNICVCNIYYKSIKILIVCIHMYI